MALVGGKLVVSYYKDVLTHLEVHGLDGALDHEIALPEAGTASDVSSSPDDDVVRFEFSSFTRPREIDEVPLTAPARRCAEDVGFRPKVAADLSRFPGRGSFFYPSKDGTRVPIFVVHAKDMKRDGSAPMLLEGYGGFDLTYGPKYYPSSSRGSSAAVCTPGRTCAAAENTARRGTARGCSTRSRTCSTTSPPRRSFWNREGFAKPERTVAYGSSNGGLLMGAAATQRPDLFRVVLCGAPLLDTIRYPLSGRGRCGRTNTATRRRRTISARSSPIRRCIASRAASGTRHSS